MKKTLLLAVLTMMAATGASAQMLVDFTAESIPNSTGTTVASTNGAAGPFNAETNNLAAGATAQVTGFHATTTAAYSTPSGNGSTKSLSANNWSTGDYYQFTLSNTTGLTVTSVNFAAYSSSTGPANFNFQYSINGAAYVTVSAYTVGATGFLPTATTTNDTVGFNFNANTSAMLSNSANSISFRLTDASTTSVGGGTVATTGTSRFDDFIVSSSAYTPAPEPGAWAAVVLGGATLLAVQRRRKGARVL